jgi:hypothetical protein
MKEEIPFVTGGSGLLVFDRNEDHIANDGKELFGPVTGNGFAELSRYDDDRNGWIDENESIYKNLYVWTRNGNEDILHGLKGMGVGALYVGSVDSSFDLKDDKNHTRGQIIRSGVYLAENGQAGSVQQLDLFV